MIITSSFKPIPFTSQLNKLFEEHYFELLIIKGNFRTEKLAKTPPNSRVDAFKKMLEAFLRFSSTVIKA